MVKTEPETVPSGQTKKNTDTDNVGGITLLDLLRILGGLLIVSCGLSYIVADGSLTWGYHPWFLSVDQVRGWIREPLYLTTEELRAFDGSDPKKPIYLGLNGTIYDVSANPTTYGKGGSYNHFAGRDHARAFITGCFGEDQTADLRGVEEMYIPIDPPDSELTDEQRAKKSAITKAQMKVIREREYREARKKVRDGIAHWAAMFRGEQGKPYFEVGKIKREKGWLKKLPRRELCAEAKKARPKRKYD